VTSLFLGHVRNVSLFPGGPGQCAFPGDDRRTVWPLGEGFAIGHNDVWLAMTRPARACVPDGKTIYAKVTHAIFLTPEAAGGKWLANSAATKRSWRPDGSVSREPDGGVSTTFRTTSPRDSSMLALRPAGGSALGGKLPASAQ
jgi:hypothetical protein